MLLTKIEHILFDASRTYSIDSVGSYVLPAETVK